MNYTPAGELRRQEFEDALLVLMGRMPYSKISVKDLAAQAHYVHKTFYHYYTDKQACLEALADRLILEGNLHVGSRLPDGAPLRDRCRCQLEFWIGHRDFLTAISRNGMSSFLVERFLIVRKKETDAKRPNPYAPFAGCDGDILFCYLSGQICLLLKWCDEGFPHSIDEMCDKYMQTLYRPLLPAEPCKS